MSKSPSTECEETICKMFKGRKNNEEYHNCNKVYYYLDYTKTHPDGGWFTCRNGGAGDACRSKAIKKTGFSFGQVREKPGDKFYGKDKDGILYNAFKDTFDRPFQNTPLSDDRRKYVFQKKKTKKKEGDKCGDKIVYLVPREMLNNFRVKEAITQDDLKNQENLEAGDLVELIQTFKTNFLFKTIMPPEWTKKFLKNNWDLLSALSKITSHGNPFDPVKINFEQTYMKLNKGGGRTKRKRKKRRRKTRVKRKKTQKRKKAKRKYKKRRTKRRR